MDGLDPRNSYNFRVRAKNSYGWGSYSNESGIVSLSELTLVAESPHSVGVIIGIILLSSFVLGLFGLLFILREYNAFKFKIPAVARHVKISLILPLIQFYSLSPTPFRKTTPRKSPIIRRTP